MSEAPVATPLTEEAFRILQEELNSARVDAGNHHQAVNALHAQITEIRGNILDFCEEKEFDLATINGLLESCGLDPYEPMYVATLTITVDIEFESQHVLDTTSDDDGLVDKIEVKLNERIVGEHSLDPYEINVQKILVEGLRRNDKDGDR